MVQQEKLVFVPVRRVYLSELLAASFSNHGCESFCVSVDIGSPTTLFPLFLV